MPDRPFGPTPSPASDYEGVYRDFDVPLMRQIRREAYGVDIGQHSWVTAEELREDSDRLRLTPASRLLDLGCGPGGPLTFLISTVGASGVGLELSPSAIRIASARAVELGVESRLSAQLADLEAPLPPGLGAFDAVIALDVVVHLRNRSGLFHEAVAHLRPGGRFLLTDAGVLTGAASAEELRRRSPHGMTQFVPVGWNERLIADAGLRLLEVLDRTDSVARSASGRLGAYRRHRRELEQLWGETGFERQVEYLETAIALSERAALSRFAYLAEAR